MIEEMGWQREAGKRLDFAAGGRRFLQWRGEKIEEMVWRREAGKRLDLPCPRDLWKKGRNEWEREVEEANSGGGCGRQETTNQAKSLSLFEGFVV